MLAFTLTICYLALILKCISNGILLQLLIKELKTNIILIIFTINNNIYIFLFQKDKIDNKFFRIKVEGNGSR